MSHFIVIAVDCLFERGSNYFIEMFKSNILHEYLTIQSAI